MLIECMRFPVKRAFALAVGDVTEGMMFDELGLDLTLPLDATGQLYSTLMRCRDPSRVKVLVPTAKG
ncbi:hypothetical protein BGZ97_005245 [Linnemannia gamsii]|uniref:Uncharacterized protein n=1 Tax=Linnemannia gamsii TaxID=64522 RepID=A0A9P6QS86_9FUNG|nr:hypothetical protein BGZ97_005245 [Linnemannia gamsii]